MALRPYQSAAVDQLRAAIRRGRRRVLLVAPTGAGKTVMAGEIIRGAVQRGGRVCFLAHRRELVEQCSARLSALGVAHGIVMPGHGYDRSGAVLVASVQTLARRPDVLPPTVWIVDEAHHARAATYEQILARAPSAPVVGLSATPWRTDGKGLGELFEEVVVAARVAELTEAGYLVPARGFAFLSPQLAAVHVRGGDYDQRELEEATSRAELVGDVVGQWQARAGGARTVAFACSIAHSRRIVEAFRAAGVAAEHLDGAMPPAERAAVLRRLAGGFTRVVANCAVLTEGWDMPAVECCILARPTLSAGLYLQMVGRVLRPAPGKTSALIHDHAGCVLRHGLPADDRDYSLASDDRQPQGGRAEPVRRCAECGALYDPAVHPEACPECGREHAAEVRAAREEHRIARVVELKELEAARKAREQRRRNKGTPDAEKRALFESWIRFARGQGWRDGWAWHRYREHFGVLPRGGNRWRNALGSRDPARDHAVAE